MAAEFQEHLTELNMTNICFDQTNDNLYVTPHGSGLGGWDLAFHRNRWEQSLKPALHHPFSFVSWPQMISISWCRFCLFVLGVPFVCGSSCFEKWKTMMPLASWILRLDRMALTPFCKEMAWSDSCYKVCNMSIWIVFILIEDEFDIRISILKFIDI